MGSDDFTANHDDGEGEHPSDPEWDVVVIGGSIAGAATAWLLLRRNPGLRVVVVEKSGKFSRRVGESTVEVSSYFLGRVLEMGDHLRDDHVLKQGMRFWFYNDRSGTLAECSEIGGRYLSRIPTYQIDRSVFDEALLTRAASAGATVWRDRSVQRVDANGNGNGNRVGSVVRVRDGATGRTEEIRTRWVVDASGHAAFMARRRGWYCRNDDHPIAAAWSRWRGVKDWDGPRLSEKFPEWSRACFGMRTPATNHLMGRGWWAWMIPLKGGDVSIGVVLDPSIADWESSVGDPSASMAVKLRRFLWQHPVARELLEDAHCLEGDAHFRGRLPYSVSTVAEPGLVLVGDAAGFLDPFYSPGLDWLGYTVTNAVELIASREGGETSGSEGESELWARYNRKFKISYDRWFNAIYRGKYEYLGDFDLMRLAFSLDLGLYYLGVASQPYKRGAAAYMDPVFHTPPSLPVYGLMRLYNRRLAAIGRARRKNGTLGRANDRRRFLLDGFHFNATSVLTVSMWLARWLVLELAEGWRSWGRGAGRGRRVDAGPRNVHEQSGGVSAPVRETIPRA